MRFLIDMNLTPDCVTWLANHGHDAIHWSRVGPKAASDQDIMRWALENDQVVLTGDLDFGAELARSGSDRPSVVQLRTSITLPTFIGPIVSEALERHEARLLAGALLTIRSGRFRIRDLPLRHP